ncbi:ABC transporter substrate-binding protein [Halomonas sp. MCCC 1A17488]|uniref:ABC transporter substrate-binding protein n=1 Tax=Billgrantia sulfidoxydans TaxID=2733484 RepID=A0ABX7W9K0_9GAMM|nr:MULTISPECIES: ABC transporter substrate-binding protein [Halomonas]MCE8018486.1 ABC transporter substrate-binding protein [Halomonas sp. MCCC 1A17488]MCG3241819.1 ABC transporter substrate-binding protein [Halomonas sp. MCCC 1A17488]QPP49184.1 ABC transporter substrate-binding protein [Halomonas sp. SS10-MC5]QTP56520.1 ABC transporter substrate-binding protein [Halomonas sulfidoxydans]
MSTLPRSLRWLALGGLACGLGWPALLAAETLEPIVVGYLGMERPDDREPLSVLDPVLDDEGVQGARLGISDNNASAQFLGQEFVLHEAEVAQGGDVGAALEALVEQGVEWIVSGLPGEAVSELMAHPARGDRVVFNAGSPDDALRGEACHPALYHTTPSRRMLADALAQFLGFKRWDRWALVYGNTEEDRILAEALRAAAERYGHRIVGDRQWPYDPMARRAEGGFHAIQREIPVFVQELPEHDVLVIADETDYFGEYFPYQTWLPRPVVGTQGLIATPWHRAHESWGAVQLQRRFEEHAERWMTPRDFGAWLAVRSLGEAAARTGSVERQAILDYLLGEEFELAGYLGLPVSYRRWNHQLRQPILITGPRMVASVSPQEGYLHSRTPLDSLGADEGESTCRF